MSPTRTVVSLAVLWLVCLAGMHAQQTVVTAVPRLVNFSGKAVDSQGKTIAGVAGATFAIYRDQTGGAPLWLETQNVTTDSKGNFTAQLGAAKSDGLPLDLFTSAEARWLGVSINGGQEQPRILLLSVPYALRAADAETVGGLPPSAFVLATLASVPSQAAASTTANKATLNAAPPPGTVSGSGTANFVPLWTDNADIGNSVLFQSGSGAAAKIGINTTTPAATLDVRGAGTIRGLLTLPSIAAANATKGSNSQPLGVTASAFNSASNTAVNQNFRWQAEPTGNNTTAPSATLNLLFGSGNGAPAETGLKVSSQGLFTFATGQSFPGAGTISGVTAGTGLTGGGSTGSVTLNLDTTKVPQLNVANTFTGNQTMNGNLTATGVVTGSSFQIGSNLFAFGSFSVQNAFLGFAGNSTTSGYQNTGSGFAALASNSSGFDNTATGFNALFANTSGGGNTAHGRNALGANTTGFVNTATGDSALFSNTTGQGNTASGQAALYNNATGSDNTALGYLAGPDSSTTSLTNSTAIGAFADVTASNALVLGSINGVNGATADTLVGIGTTAPAAKLDVRGTANFTGLITFAPGQTFPGTGTITGVTAGTGLTGGGTGGSLTLNLDTTKVPQLNTANNFTANQSVTGNVTATGTMTGGVVNASTSFNLGGSAFAFGSFASSNAFLGFSGNSTITGTGNAGVGSGAFTFNTTGSNNAAIGINALVNNTTGSNNSAAGGGALFLNTTGGNNTASGNLALGNNGTGSNNSALGYNAGPDSSHPSLTNSTAIGANAVVGASNALVLGGTGANAVSVGIGTATPASTLDVRGTGNFTGPITFAAGQTFPGTGTITGITPGTALTGGGSSGGVTLNVDTTKVVTGVAAGTGLTGGGTGGVQTLNLDTTKVPQLSTANNFTANQSVTGNLTATGSLTAATVNASTYDLGGAVFAFGSQPSGDVFLGFSGSALNTGGSNTGTGAYALGNNGSGSQNVGVGTFSLYFNTIGSGNTALGQYSLEQNGSGNFNTAVGYGAGPGPFLSTLTNATAIGASAEVDTSNAMVLGSINGVNSATANTNVGIGTTAPLFPLHVERNDNSGAGIQIVAENQSTSGASFAIFNATSDNGVTAIMVADGIGTGALHTPSGYFGTYTNQPIGLITANVERLHITAAGLVGVGTSAPTHIFQVGQGAGAAFADSWSTYSSRRWKTNIQTLPDALAKVEQLRGVSYDLKSSGKHEIGVIAEEVGKVLPEIVSFEANGKDAQGVDYTRLTALLIEAVKQQQREIAAQRLQIRAQQQQMASLKTRLGSLETSTQTARAQRRSAGLSEQEPKESSSSRPNRTH